MLKTSPTDIGADAVLECVGTEQSMDTAFAIARPGAIVGRVGVPHDVDRRRRVRSSATSACAAAPLRLARYIPELLNDVLDGIINPGKVFDLRPISTTSPTPTRRWTNGGRSSRHLRIGSL